MWLEMLVLLANRIIKLKLVLFVLAGMALAIPASAVPVTYGMTIGTITVQANRASDNALVFDETLTLSTDSFVTWDAAGVPGFGSGGTLDDFEISIDPGQGPFSTLAPYGPFDQITVETASITPDTGIGFGTNFTFPSGGSTFQFNAGQIMIDALYSASNSGTGATTPGPVAADITGVNNLAGTITFNAGGIQVVMDSIVMGTLDGTPFGEFGNDLTLTANVNFFGDANVLPTPEPSTALLLGMGLSALAARRR